MVTNAAGDPFEALGDPNRRDILRLLSEGDKPVRDIAAALPISRPAVSRHLRLLKEAGLVAEQARGTSRIYHLRDEGLHAVQEYLERVWGDAARRFRLMAENMAEDTENTGRATRVEIEHRGWERLGPDAQPWRDRNQANWQTLLPHFITAISKGER